MLGRMLDSAWQLVAVRQIPVSMLSGMARVFMERLVCGRNAIGQMLDSRQRRAARSPVGDMALVFCGETPGVADG